MVPLPRRAAPGPLRSINERDEADSVGDHYWLALEITHVGVWEVETDLPFDLRKDESTHEARHLHDIPGGVGRISRAIENPRQPLSRDDSEVLVPDDISIPERKGARP